MALLVTLTTDFGARDPYMAEMKAVILGLNPAVQFIDVTHEVAAHDVLEGPLASVGDPVRLALAGDLPRGRAGALVGSHGRLEVAVREDSAAARLHGRRGTRVILSRSRTSRGPRRARS